MKKHLEVLDLLAAGKISNQDPRVEEALREAVAFCRAAQPLDEAAEREHCEECADVIDLSEGRHLRRDHIADLVRRERDAARAEVVDEFERDLKEEVAALNAQLSAAQAELTALKEAAQPLDEAAETRICEAICLPLAAAQWLESVDAVRAGRAQARVDGYADGAQRGFNMGEMRHIDRAEAAEAQLSTAQAEIANQQSQVAELQCLGVELETKLTNLRDELEHAAVELETSGTSMRDSRLAARIRSVLEASR